LTPRNSLRALVKKLGREETAARLGVSERTLRRPSARLLERASDALERSLRATRGWETRREREYEREEREGIQAADDPARQRLYAEELPALHKNRGDVWVQQRDTAHFIKNLEKRSMPVPDSERAKLAYYTLREKELRDIIWHITPTDTLEERLYKVNNIDSEYMSIARKYNLSARAVYSLYYSPPAGATV
jgi:transcriptional regulator with XRE-family HTH domain